MNSNDPKEKPPRSQRDDITTMLTFGFMAAFFISLVALFGMAQASDPPASAATGVQQKDWFDLFKNGLVLLGSSLTIIIGYYFGRQEASAGARAEVKKKEEELVESKQEVNKKEQNVETASFIIEELKKKVKEFAQAPPATGSAPEAFDPARAQRITP